MDVGAAKLFGRDFFTGGGFDQRRSAKKDGALVADNDGFVAHCGNIRPACRTRSENSGNLIDALRRHSRLIVEYAAEVVAIGKDLGLQRQKGAA